MGFRDNSRKRKNWCFNNISGIGFGNDHDSGIVSNKHHKNKDVISSDRGRVNLLINGAIKKRGVSCFIGREVKGVKARKHTLLIDISNYISTN